MRTGWERGVFAFVAFALVSAPQTKGSPTPAAPGRPSDALSLDVSTAGNVTIHARDREPVQLETEIVARQSRTMTPDRPSPRSIVRAKDTVRIRRDDDGATEELSLRPTGVEQSWLFDAPPPGTGDLVVRVRSRDARLDADGHVHLGNTSSRGFVYSPATWRDARGVERVIASRLEDGAIEMRVPSATLESSVYPAVLDPLVSPEIVLDAVPPRTNADTRVTDLSLAYGTNDYLAVWVSGSFGELRSAFVSRTGNVTSELSLPGQLYNGESTAADFDGTQYFIVRTSRGSLLGRTRDASSYGPADVPSTLR